MERLIPKIIHQTYKGHEIPAIYKRKWIESWREHHPGYEFIFWTDLQLELLAKSVLGREEIQRFMQAPGIIKADIGRLMVLFTLGGIYADLDYMALKPMDGIIRGEDLYLPRIQPGKWRRKPYIHNALMASAPGNQVMGMLVSAAWSRWLDKPKRVVEWISGPELLTELCGQLPKRNFWEADQVTPLDWATDQGRSRKRWDQMVENPHAFFPDAHAITYWVHGW